MTQHKDQMRAEFEAWCCPQADKNAIAKFDDGFYMSAKTSMAWSAWQAALASAPTGVMEDGQWNIEGANIGEIEAYEHGARSTMSIVQRILDGDSDIGPLSSPMRDYRALMDEVRALKASAAQGVPEGLPDFYHPTVQAIYEILADSDTPTPDGEHYEGFAARRIYAMLQARKVSLPPAPHKLGDVELWPRHVIEEYVRERTADLEQGSKWSADLFQQAKDDWQMDAERYQYIRGNGHYVVKCGSNELHCGGHVNLNQAAFGDAMDAAIDKAMKDKP